MGQDTSAILDAHRDLCGMYKNNTEVEAALASSDLVYFTERGSGLPLPHVKRSSVLDSLLPVPDGKAILIKPSTLID